MFLDERYENFVRERAWLSVFRIGADRDVPILLSAIELDRVLVRELARFASWQNIAPETRKSVFSM